LISTFNEPIESLGCGPTMNVSIIVHGWLEGLNPTEWVNTTIANLLKYSQGCVFFFDYSVYSKNGNYFALVPHYEGIRAVLVKKLLQIGNPERIFMFGFSFGARLTLDGGAEAFNGTINRVDVCDPAGPGFVGTYREKQSQPAAKNVACINTSNNYGTTNYDCHQNFRMGNCGQQQAAASSYPKGHHGLCPYFYNAAFEVHFIPHNHYSCGSSRMANVTGEYVRMGYLGNFNRTKVRGDIFITTSATPPYVAARSTELWNALRTLVGELENLHRLDYQNRNAPEDDPTILQARGNVWNSIEKVTLELKDFAERFLNSAPLRLQRPAKPEEKASSDFDVLQQR
jgi:hypothetical protein